MISSINNWFPYVIALIGIVGYEMNIAKLLVDDKKSEDTIAKAYNKIVELGYCNAGLNYEKASKEIEQLNLEAL